MSAGVFYFEPPCTNARRVSVVTLDWSEVVSGPDTVVGDRRS